jgi:hypothetical protein
MYRYLENDHLGGLLGLAGEDSDAVMASTGVVTALGQSRLSRRALGCIRLLSKWIRERFRHP